MIQPSPKLYPQLTKATVVSDELTCIADIYIFPVAGKIFGKIWGKRFFIPVHLIYDPILAIIPPL
jgi:hypothetical protein